MDKKRDRAQSGRKRPAASKDAMVRSARASEAKRKEKVIHEGKVYWCDLIPGTDDIDFRACVPAEGMTALSTASTNDIVLLAEHSSGVGSENPSLVDRAASTSRRAATATTVPPAVRQACYGVAQRTAQFRKQNQLLIAQLGALDLDRSAQAFPQPVAEAMLVAEQARILLIKAFAEFESKCADLEMATTKIAVHS